VWRIEKFKVVPWKDVGTFYTGDSFIVLHTYKQKSNRFQNAEDANKLSWNIHFWLGLETSQDEAGTAAYKTVELDDFLGGAPVQYREVEGNESQAFLKLFKEMKILAGSVLSISFPSSLSYFLGFVGALRVASTT
jgi:gelsolin